MASSLPAEADVVVVGAGASGSRVARGLAEAGVSVAVLEAGPLEGGAAGRGLGLVEHGVLEHPGRTIASLGDERAAALWAWAAHSRAALAADGDLEPCGVLWVPVFGGEADDVQRSLDGLSRLGVTAEGWSVEQVRAAAGEGFDQAALWLADDGRLVPDAPERWLRRAEEAGAVLCSGERVTEVSDGADGLVVRTAEGEVSAQAVVLACGAGAASLHPALQGLMPVRDAGLRFAPGPVPRVVAGRAGQGWTVWRHDADGVRVSGARWASPHLEVGERDASTVHPGVASKLEAFARQRLGVQGPVVERWAWVFAQSPDGLPVVGPLPGDPRVVGCVGFGATPVGLEIAAADQVVAGLLGEPAEEVPWMLSSRRIVRWRYGR
jgi:glycine/D-amino acid oxidase-like deaminating enzyme